MPRVDITTVVIKSSDYILLNKILNETTLVPISKTDDSLLFIPFSLILHRLLPIQQPMLRLQTNIQVIRLNKDTQSKTETRKCTQENIYGAKTVRIRSTKSKFVSTIRRLLDDFHELCSVLSKLRCLSSILRVRFEPGNHLVLEDDAADSDTDSLAERAEEDEHGHCECDILGFRCCLELELHARK